MTGHRFRARLEYDGTDYAGFQRQRGDRPTIQGVVEAVLSAIWNEPVAVVGAGRTDAGAHALGQVIAFNLRWPHGSAALQRALNVNLPADIAVHDVALAGPAFHPRFQASRRQYRYQIDNGPVRSPLRHRHSWHVAAPLDEAAMSAAAGVLLGTHDFATFGTPPQGDVTVRRVFAATWTREGDQLAFHVEANAFLYRMVRSLVGALKLVGEGRWSVDRFATALAARDRSQITEVAPARGLCLWSVAYDK